MKKSKKRMKRKYLQASCNPRSTLSPHKKELSGQILQLEADPARVVMKTVNPYKLSFFD